MAAPLYSTNFCCEKRCLRSPRALVDGKLECGCYHWCKCACSKRSVRTNCCCGSPMFTRDEETGTMVPCGGKLIYKLQPCGHFYCVTCVQLHPYCNICNKYVSGFYLYSG